jgi:metallo-beta-lactamase class B
MLSYSKCSWTAVALLSCAQLLMAQREGTGPDKPFPPHKIISNIYFVGAEEHSSYLIVTSAGDILINSGYEATVPMIRASVEKLGFRFSDIKIILGSHAHVDHMQGDALAKEFSGARVMAMEQDVPALEKLRPGNKPHPIDQVLHDGDAVKLGETTLVAHLTPGHTKGCTSWTTTVRDGDKSYDVVIVCGMGVKAGKNYLVGNPDYPRIKEDYIRGFATLRALHCDVFLGSHQGHFNLQAKYAKLVEAGPNGPNPYIDPEGYKAHLDNYEKVFYAKLDEEMKGQSLK